MFWFHGDSLFHNSLSHKFHQPEVVALLRGFYCVQVPNEGGRSGPEQAIAQRFGIGHSMGSIVVCYWDGEELTRYGDIVETRHFVPILKSWHVANARRLRQTDKASDALGKARDLLERGDVKIAVLKLTQVLDKEGHISREVFGDAQGLRDRVLARLDGSLGEAAELRRRGLKDEARTRGEELLADYSRLPTAKQRIEDFLAGRWTAGAARAPAPAAPPAPTPAGPAPAGAPPAAAPQDPGGVRVRFSVQPGAGSRVELAGTMNDWQPSGAWALTDPDGDGRFEGEFELRPGRYLYKFVIDGQRWLQDPANPVGEDDGHQGQNSVLVVGPNGVEPAGQAPEADGAPQGAEGGFGSATRTRGKAFVGEIFFVEPGTESLPDFRGSSEGKIYAKSLNVAPRPFSDGFPG